MNHSSFLQLKLSWKNAPLYGTFFVLSFIYESLVLLRLWLYQKRVFRSKKAKVPVISVGNLTVGGAGKTPVVDFIVQELQKTERCAIISRGYGNTSESTIQRFLKTESVPSSPAVLGDEPFLLASRNPEVPIYVSRDRVLAAKLASAWDDPEVLVLDDAYQHIRMHRDLNLLLIDAERGLGNGLVLPLGELREPQEHWQRADAIILTKSNLGFSDRVIHHLRKDLKVTCPLFKFNYTPAGLKRLDGKERRSWQELSGKTAFLNCGIAQPKSLEQTVRQLGMETVECVSFQDHYAYSSEGVKHLLAQAKKANVDYWITTEKDATKLQQFPELEQHLWVLEMQVTAESAWQDFFVDFLTRIKLKYAN